MPRKNGASKTIQARADANRRMVDAALALAARQGWRHTSLGEIAQEAGLPLHEAYAIHRSKPAILDAFSRRVDAEVLSGTAANGEEPSRDRLFDAIMHRFDALQPHKAAIRAILRDSIGDPAALCSIPALFRSMAWMLEAAGGSAAGWRGRLRVQLLAGLYLSVLRIFLDDESPDLTKTMAALDRRLRRGESLLGLGGARRGEADAAIG